MTRLKVLPFDEELKNREYPISATEWHPTERGYKAYCPTFKLARTIHGDMWLNLVTDGLEIHAGDENHVEKTSSGTFVSVPLTSQSVEQYRRYSEARAKYYTDDNGQLYHKETKKPLYDFNTLQKMILEDPTNIKLIPDAWIEESIPFEKDGKKTDLKGLLAVGLIEYVISEAQLRSVKLVEEIIDNLRQYIQSKDLKDNQKKMWKGLINHACDFANEIKKQGLSV